MQRRGILLVAGTIIGLLAAAAQGQQAPRHHEGALTQRGLDTASDLIGNKVENSQTYQDSSGQGETGYHLVFDVSGQTIPRYPQGETGDQGQGDTQGMAPQPMTSDQTGRYVDPQSLFDKKSMHTVKGTVTEVTIDQVHGDLVKATIGMKKGSVLAVLGPSWYLQQQGIELKSGDKVTVRGSKVVHNGQEIVIATNLKADKHSLDIRSKQGSPMWSSRYSSGGPTGRP